MKFSDFCGVLWFIALSIIIRYCTLSRVTWVQSAPSCVYVLFHVNVLILSFQLLLQAVSSLHVF